MSSNRIVMLAAIALALVPLAGCSVGMALSGENDPDLSVLRVGASRGEVEMQLGRPAAEILADDGLTYATYAYSLGNQPSAGRAVAHGVMDVLTLGLWEVVGTPVEAAAGKENEHAVIHSWSRLPPNIIVSYRIGGPGPNWWSSSTLSMAQYGSAGLACFVVYDRDGMVVGVNQAVRREEDSMVERSDRETQRPLATNEPGAGGLYAASGS